MAGRKGSQLSVIFLWGASRSVRLPCTTGFVMTDHAMVYGNPLEWRGVTPIDPERFSIENADGDTSILRKKPRAKRAAAASEGNAN